MSNIKTWLGLIVLISSRVVGQNPIPYTSNLNNINHNAQQNYNLSYNAVNINNSNFNGLSKTDILALDNIHISPTSMAGNFNTTVSGWNPYFHAGIEGSLLNTASFHPNGFTDIPKYDRFELGIILPTIVQLKVDNFLLSQTNPNILNPYDPGAIQLKVTYTHVSSGSTYVRYGFFYKNYTSQNNLWTEVPTDYDFRVRFAPPKEGQYSATLELFLNSSSSASYYSTCSFNVIYSSNPGHLKMADGNLRKMQFENGEMFFAIGQGLPGAQFELPNSNFPNLTYWAYAVSSPNTHETHRDYLDDLADKDGNFARLRLDYWSVPIIEADKTPPPQTQKNALECLNDWSHNQMFMWEFDKTLTLCELRKIYLMLNILNDQQFTFDNNYGLQNWGNNPFSALLGNDMNGLKSFFDMANQSPQSVASKTYFRRLLYYINARWGYSTSIGIWEAINETEHIATINFNTVPINSEYYNNVGFRYKIADWVCDMKWYVESHFYPWHPWTNGTVAERYEDFPGSSFNNYINCLNISSSNDYSDDYDDGLFLNRDINRFEHQKNFFDSYRPFIFGEMGLGDGISFMVKYGDATFHNSQWASVFGGGIGTAMYWNDIEQPLNDHRSNFIGIKSFVNKIDFTEVLQPGIDFEFGNDHPYNKKIMTYWLMNWSKSKTYGWTVNTTYNWTTEAYYNMPTNLQQTVNSITGFNGIGQAHEYLPSDKKMVVRGLKNATTYRIDFYNTHDTWNQDLLEQQYVTSENNGDLKFMRKLPAYIGSPWYPDYAFIITEANINNRPVNDSDTIQLVGGKINSNEITSNSISVYPNPGIGKYQIYSQLKNAHTVKVYNTLGALVKTFSFTGSKYEVNIEDLSPGIYNFVVKNADDATQSIKVIKE